MGIIRPATPGFIVTLVATILLAVVSFSVPWLKSVFFLKASLSVEGISGSITFGTLGYCLELNNGTTCSSPSIGYEIDVNKLVGNNLPIQIPEVVVKWLTYALFLHVVALILAAISALFGLLAHIREMSMTCFSTCVSGFAASVALIAFIFDLAFFFVARSRINAVEGGSASMGNAIWLTLVAWILLFLSGCFFGLGKCCIRRRPRDPWGHARDTSGAPSAQGVAYADRMRLDAVKDEADRKARQKRQETGLPAFEEYEDLQPLTAGNNDDASYHDNTAYPIAGGRSSANGQAFPGGYAPAASGSQAVDEFYNPSVPAHVHEQDPSNSEQYRHAVDGSTYNIDNSAIPDHEQYPSLSPETYINTAGFHAPTYSPLLQSPQQSSPHPSRYYTSPTQSPTHSHMLGGGGYGSNFVPAPAPLPARAREPSVHSDGSRMTNHAGYGAYGPQSSSPMTSAPPHVVIPSPVRGPREQRASVSYDQPPMYDDPQVWR